jgi:dolichol-phosphate mannosyltransferase
MNTEKHDLKEPVSILMPVCDEIAVIEEVLQEWFETVIPYLPPGSEMLIDDASHDGTENILQKWAAQNPCLKIHHQENKDGFYAAAFRLYRAARCPLVFFTDSDGQYFPADFWKSAALIGECDIVHGYKAHRKDPYYRILASAVFNWITRPMFKHHFHDVNSVHRLARREKVLQLLPNVRHMPTLLHAEMLLRAHKEGFRIKEVAIGHRARKFGESKGLPMRTFFIECIRAYRGLFRLRREYSA